MKMKVQPTNPYLTVKGASDAIALYQKVLGAREDNRMMHSDGKRIIHAHLTINGGWVMLSDDFPEHPEYGAPTAPSLKNPAPVATAVHYGKAAEVDATYQRAMKAGCASVMEPHDAFWDARFAMFGDPFGHRWMLTAPLAKKPAAKKAAAKKPAAKKK